MIETLNYLLLLGAFLILCAGFCYNHLSAESAFIRISMVFLAIFFVIPAYQFMVEDGMLYVGQFRLFDDLKMANALISFYAFVLGFFGKEIAPYLSVTQKRNKRWITKSNITIHVEKNLSTRRCILFALVSSITFIAYLVFRPSAEVLYQVRSGLNQVSPMYLVLGIVSQTLMISMFFLLTAIRRWELAILVILILLASEIQGSTGRTNLMILLMLPFVYVSGLRAVSVAKFIPVGFLFGFTLVLIGKAIIFSVSTEGIIPDIDSLTYEIENIQLLFFQNFAHPFISIYEVSSLLEIIGIRAFYDFPQGVLFYLKIIGLDFGSSLTYYNTENILGLHSSITPPGYIAFGFVQAGYLGVFMMGIFFRFCFKVIISTSLAKIVNTQVFLFYISFLTANTFYTGEIRTLVLSFFLPVLVMHISGKFVAIKTKRMKVI